MTDLRTNADAMSFAADVDRGVLSFQKCCSCGHVQFPPRHLCASCWGDELETVESLGRGVIESITIVRRAPLPDFRDRVPYAIVAVETAEGPRMITNLIGSGALDAKIGDQVCVAFEEAPGGTLPQFKLEAAN